MQAGHLSTRRNSCDGPLSGLPAFASQVPTGMSRRAQASPQTPMLDADVLGDLIDLNIFDIEKCGKSPQERRLSLMKNFDAIKQQFIESLRQNVDNPYVRHVANRASLSVSEMEQLIASMSMDITKVQRLNLSGTTVAKQSPFHIRSFYSELEDKQTLLADMAWMQSRPSLSKEQLTHDLKILAERSENRLAALHQDPAPHVDTFCVGRGNNMTKYFEYMPNKQSASILFVGQNNGTWQGHYQLAQTSGVLEFGPETAASNHNADLHEAFSVSQVDANHLYQGMVHSQCIHDFPGVAAEVSKVTHGETSGYQIEIAYTFMGEIQLKTVHADKLVIGTGLSQSKNIFYQKGQFFKEDFRPIVGDGAGYLFRSLVQAGYFQPSGRTKSKTPDLDELRQLLSEKYTKNQIELTFKLINRIDQGRALGSQISKADYEQLAQFNTERGFTPLVDGSTFILSDAECAERGKGRQILIWGGGGTAAAAVRRGMFLKDIPKLKVTPESYEKERVNDVLWIARNGFDTLRDGTLAVDAKTTLGQAGKLWDSCELIGIEPREDKIRVLIDRYHRVDNPSDHEQVVMRDIAGAPYPCVAERQVVEVDQLVHNLGQDNRNIEQLFEGIHVAEETIEIVKDPDLDVPLYGTLTGHPNIQFHGAAFVAGSLTRKAGGIMETAIAIENTPPDVGPGSMPLAWATIRAAHLSDSDVHYDAVNATMDFGSVIDKHLAHWGISDSDVREAFLKDVVENRTETRGGITTRTLNRLIDKYDLKGKVTVDGVSMLRPLVIAEAAV